MNMPCTNNFLNLEEKVAIITGAASGLGAETAKMLSKAGAKVLINHLPGQESDAQSVASECPNDSICHAGDITQDEQCQDMAQAALQRWGQVDILINNAGINKPVEHDDLEGLSAQDFLNIYNVNVVGAYQMIRAVTPFMNTQKGGVVVNVSSASGESGYGSSVAYSASKGAINTMTKSLARALAPHIRVNAVCPGFIATPLWDKLNLSSQQREELRQDNINETPLRIEATPDLIARSILFLASDLSENITGQLLTSDGGILLGVYRRMFENVDGGRL